MSQTSLNSSSTERVPLNGLASEPCSISNRCLTASLIAAGVIQILLGIGSIAAPQIAAIAAEVLFGTIVLIAGVAEMIFAWDVRTFSGSSWRFLRAACFLAAAAILFFFPLTGIMTLAFVLGFTFVLDGGLQIMVTSHIHRRRGLIILDGIIGLIVGVMILTGWPQDSVFIVGTVVGIRLLLSGILVLMMGAAFGKSSVGC